MHRRRLAFLSWVTIAIIVCGGGCARLYVEAPVGGSAIADQAPLSVVYLIGDFGKPGQPFDELTAVIAADVGALDEAALRTAPMVLELGDNLYEEGLPHDLAAPGARAEVDKLAAIAAGFARVRYGDAPVPLVLIPGNHDYANNALDNSDNLGDITRWYFLDELGVAGTDTWVQVPGNAAPFADAASLYAHLSGGAAAHAAFMQPIAVPHVDDDLRIIAVDSELLLDLYATDQDGLVDTYWEGLERELAATPGGAWRFIAVHHPPVTYGKHGEPSWGNWVFGQGWPQFPSAWQKALAAAVPLGIVAGVVVHPAALALSVATPVSTALVTGRKQDVGSDPYDRYAAELLRIAAAHDVDGIVAGHDHNTQLIELGAVDGFGGDTLLVITGAGSKVDPVRRGAGTVAYLSDYSFVRLTQYAAGLSFEVIDRRGRSRFRYDLRR